MVLTKKAGRLIIIYSLAAVLVMGGFLLRVSRERDALKLAGAVSYDHAFAELNQAVGSLDTSIRKTLCAASPSMISAVCAQGYAQSAAAGQAISSLPYGNIELEHTAAFLTRAGDYLLYLSRAGAKGHSLTQEERQALTALAESSGQVSRALSELTARLLDGQISVSELEQAESQIRDAGEELERAGFVQGFRDMESELPELPSLIYDGPFSDHIRRDDPALLRGLEAVGQEEAAEKGAKFLGVKPESLTFSALREGDIPVYVFTHQDGAEVETVEVTRAGGKVIFYGTVREGAEGSVSPQAAATTAGRFLEAHGFSSMTPTYHEAEAGELVVSFAYEQDGILCYPDLVKVMVALDTGKVCGMEAAGYVMCHRERELSPSTRDWEQAKKGLSPFLTPVSHRPALIPTQGQNEVLCEEYLCQTPEGTHALVYLNADTGEEEKILLLLESESGTLSI